MENHHRQYLQANRVHDAEIIRSVNTPNSTSSSSNVNRSATATSPAAPLTPKSITCRSIDRNSCPTTFVQADISSFKQVVQMLTGSSSGKHAAEAPPKNPLSPAAKANGPRKPAFKLYERRNSLKNLKMIRPTIPSFHNSNTSWSSVLRPHQRQETLSPSVLDSSLLALGPVTPSTSDPFDPTSGACTSTSSSESDEDCAIATKGTFYLHSSPRIAEPPRLLPLFPEMSQRLASASAVATT